MVYTSNNYGLLLQHPYRLLMVNSPNFLAIDPEIPRDRGDCRSRRGPANVKNNTGWWFIMVNQWLING
jgi:hypothetical protein